jgi:hypothetical protein
MGLPANIIGIMGKKQGYLPLTTAWIAATLETDTTILNALNTFEASLIANSMSSDLIAYYPMVGGDSTKHSYNFMNTSLYNLSFNGFWTHSATGALPNGTNAYANTGYNINLLSQNDTHISYYSRTSNTTNAIDMGATGGALQDFTYLSLRSASVAIAVVNALSTNFLSEAAFTNTLALGIATRTTSNNTKLFRRTTKTESILLNSVNNFPSQNIYIGARNANGTALGFTNRQCAFASIGTGFSDAEANTFYTLVQAMQTSLSRQV